MAECIPIPHLRKLDNIFHRGWVYVGHASEIPNSGDFRLRQIGQQTAIMVRDDEGQVQLFMNRCPHRANAVCQVERGNTKAFRCAYHGWSFATNGELKGIPYHDRYPDSFRKRRPWPAQGPRMGTYRSFVFGLSQSASLG
jgi:phenylpropionate dioxygenase-like ring-hydroxylating dioxygenase large terminal subunit